MNLAFKRGTISGWHKTTSDNFLQLSDLKFRDQGVSMTEFKWQPLSMLEWENLCYVHTSGGGCLISLHVY